MYRESAVMECSQCHCVFQDVTFLYGLAIVYFHYNAYKWYVRMFLLGKEWFTLSYLTDLSTPHHHNFWEVLSDAEINRQSLFIQKIIPI